AILAILASLLLPALGRAKAKAQSIACINNLKQLQLAWQMYSEDNNDVLPLNDAVGSGAWGTYRSTAHSWVVGNALNDTNDANIKLGTLCRYAGSSAVYKCSADKSTVLNKPQFARTRHYSMSKSM